VTGPDFDNFCRVVREQTGIVLTPEKGYLVSSRLIPIARSEGLAGVPELLAHLRGAPSPVLVQRCVDAMATHESSFFRDGAPFEQLATEVLPALIAARQTARTLRIWCAACSSGQEPYTVAMILQEMGAQLSSWRLEIVATDMSEPILGKAKAGLYSDFEVRRGLSPERLKRWFVPQGTGWQVSPALRQMVQFRPHNLLQGAAGLGTFDVILCRNVLIYFDLNRKRQILDDLARALAPDGALYLGSAETVLGVSAAFQPTPGSRGLYRPAQAPATLIARSA
jgi:chemotaxis protein methyltransferase CheR